MDILKPSSEVSRSAISLDLSKLSRNLTDLAAKVMKLINSIIDTLRPSPKSNSSAQKMRFQDLGKVTAEEHRELKNLATLLDRDEFDPKKIAYLCR